MFEEAFLMTTVIIIDTTRKSDHNVIRLVVLLRILIVGIRCHHT